MYFFFTDTATPELYTLSLHDALPILAGADASVAWCVWNGNTHWTAAQLSPEAARTIHARSEEHTSELQSRVDLVCRLLLEKKKDARSRILSRTRPPHPGIALRLRHSQ